MSCHARRFKNEKWEKSAEANYHNNTPVVASDVKKCQTYCSCTAGHWLCKSCHMDHAVDEVTA
eukprot:8339624-Ditylum_brightwellii.AAC.1